MKKLFVLLFVSQVLGLLYLMLLVSIVFAVNKNVVYDNDTKEIEGVKISTKTATSIGKIDVICENNKILYGYNSAKLSTIAIDEKSIPADIITTTYKIDVDKKEIFQEVILEEEK